MIELIRCTVLSVSGVDCERCGFGGGGGGGGVAGGVSGGGARDLVVVD